MMPNSYARDAINLLGATVLMSIGPTVTQFAPGLPPAILIAAGVITGVGVSGWLAVMIGLFFRVIDATAEPCACQYCREWERLAREADERFKVAIAHSEHIETHVSSIARVVGAHQAELILGETLSKRQRELLGILSNANEVLDERIRRTYSSMT